MKHVKARATVRVQRWGSRAKTTEVEVRVALACASTDNGRSLRQYKFSIDGGSLQVADHAEMALINARNLAHDFGVKLSTCMCHISCPGWRNG